ncbi:MAG: hypothetical protein KF823_04025 [Xanthomonadales bacterium]|nr:hypothetical protein [Xanthomonadales bacterium]
MSNPLNPALGPDGRPVGSPPVAATTVVATVADGSAVSWAAILAGAVAAAALSLILVMLGSGLGLSSVSPWAYEGVSAEALGWATIVWIGFTAVAASGLGGYLAGRLRRRWTGVHGDETYFRDTAHGLLSWAVATLLTAAFLTTSIATILGTGARAAAGLGGATMTSVAAGGAAGSEVSPDGPRARLLAYHVDALLRGGEGSTGATPVSPAGVLPGMGEDATTVDGAPVRGRPVRMAAAPGERDEIARILDHGLRGEGLDDDDLDYLSQRVALRTGMDNRSARARVEAVQTRLSGALESAETEARELADEARKVAARASLWLFITLLMGAFSGALFATFGGRQRDL